MGRFIGRITFCVATELVALVITDKIWKKTHPKQEKAVIEIGY